MFKRILTLMRQDLTNSLRDNMVAYMMVAPLLLALGAKFFLPSLDDVKIRMVLDGSTIEPALVEKFSAYGLVEILDNRQEVEQRVEKNDDVIGFVKEEGEYRVILEGNEEEGEEIAEVLLYAVLSEKQAADYKHIETSQKSLITQYGAAVFILSSTLLAALVAGMNIVHDKETGAIKALAVSPLRLSEYTISKGLFAGILGLILVYGSSLILLGPKLNYGMILIGFLFSIGIPVIIGYLVGGLADTQIQAMAVLKILLFAYLTFPVASIFVPRAWHFFFYILPNYWMFQIFISVFVGQVGQVNFWLACLLTLVSSLVFICILLPTLKKRLKLG